MPMRDPHVVALVYRAKAPNGFVYHDPPPVEGETESFRLRLDTGRLRVEPKAHIASPDEIRPDVERLTRSWMIASSLERGFPEIEFEYERAEILDRIPPPPGVVEGHGVAMAGGASVRASGTVTSNRYAYPEPPLDFAASPDVETLWNRYQGFLAGREPLPSMAYFCFTAIVAMAGGVDEASARFKIARPVLKKLSELSSTRGGATDARKYEAKGTLTPLSQPERKWLDAVVRQVIRRVGQEATGAAPLVLAMTDLPPLGP